MSISGRVVRAAECLAYCVRKVLSGDLTDAERQSLLEKLGGMSAELSEHLIWIASNVEAGSASRLHLHLAGSNLTKT